MGARGNSGVITSQILRGFAEALAGKSRFNGLDLANALESGTKAAYGAVAKPVEGTILTVIREASAASVVIAERENDLETVLTVTLEAAEKSVARTPSLLPILREAGVVDSGGQGLYRLFQGALLFLVGRAPEAARPATPALPPAAAASASLSAALTVASMFEPVSPSGTGKTLRPLISSTWSSRLATAARNVPRSPGPSQLRRPIRRRPSRCRRDPRSPARRPDGGPAARCRAACRGRRRGS